MEMLRAMRCQASTALPCLFLLLASTAACGPCGYNTFVETHGVLAGDEVVPAVESSNSGTILALSAAYDEGGWEGQSLTWRMTTSLAPSEVTAVHIHEGVRGQNGAVIFTLPERFFNDSDPITVGATMDYHGTVPMEELIDLMHFEGAYVDIHTHRYPNGEVRAQLELTRFSGRSGYYCS